MQAGFCKEVRQVESFRLSLYMWLLRLSEVRLVHDGTCPGCPRCLACCAGSGTRPKPQILNPPSFHPRALSVEANLSTRALHAVYPVECCNTTRGPWPCWAVEVEAVQLSGERVELGLAPALRRTGCVFYARHVSRSCSHLQACSALGPLEMPMSTSSTCELPCRLRAGEGSAAPCLNGVVRLSLN